MSVEGQAVALSAEWYHIQAVLLIIAIVVMIVLCWRAAFTTGKRRYWGEYTIPNSHIDAVSFVSLAQSSLIGTGFAAILLVKEACLNRELNTAIGTNHGTSDLPALISARGIAVAILGLRRLRWLVLDRLSAVGARCLSPTFGIQWYALACRRFAFPGAKAAYRTLTVIEAELLAAMFAIHGIHSWLVSHLVTPIRSNSSIPQKVVYA
jgi:hypothetical protein